MGKNIGIDNRTLEPYKKALSEVIDVVNKGVEDGKIDVKSLDLPKGDDTLISDLKNDKCYIFYNPNDDGMFLIYLWKSERQLEINSYRFTLFDTNGKIQYADILNATLEDNVKNIVSSVEYTVIAPSESKQFKDISGMTFAELYNELGTNISNYYFINDKFVNVTLKTLPYSSSEVSLTFIEILNSNIRYSAKNVSTTSTSLMSFYYDDIGATGHAWNVRTIEIFSLSKPPKLYYHELSVNNGKKVCYISTDNSTNANVNEVGNSMIPYPYTVGNISTIYLLLPYGLISGSYPYYKKKAIYQITNTGIVYVEDLTSVETHTATSYGTSY